MKPFLLAKNMTELTQEYVKTFFDYNAQTGVLIWRITKGPNTKVGKAVGAPNHDGYLRMELDGKGIFVHRLIWLYVYGSLPFDRIDHVNGVRNDNRLRNLREATNEQNMQNQRRPHKTNKSGFMGVSWHKRTGKWVAQIGSGKKKIYIGLFKNPEEAHAEYLKEKRKLHPFSNL